MAEEESTRYRDYARFQLALPEHVLATAIAIDALQYAYPARSPACEYCNWMAWGIAVGASEAPTDKCEHYARLDEFLEARNALARQHTPEEQGLLKKSNGINPIVRPEWRNIPEGFYAVDDPREDVEEVTYWRRKNVGKRKRPEFQPWRPRGAKVRYGPRLLSSDPRLKDLKGDERDRFILAWLENTADVYYDAVVETVLENPLTTAQRFAEWNMRCCMCGRALTSEDSKTLGIGPECGRGMPKEVLAGHFQTEVGLLHRRYIRQ